jgi:hypothetical protein
MYVLLFIVKKNPKTAMEFQIYIYLYLTSLVVLGPDMCKYDAILCGVVLKTTLFYKVCL